MQNHFSLFGGQGLPLFIAAGDYADIKTIMAFIMCCVRLQIQFLFYSTTYYTLLPCMVLGCLHRLLKELKNKRKYPNLIFPLALFHLTNNSHSHLKASSIVK